uniref:Syndetin n=1 Tax=Cacopsylla melanoneura TaxID=428564 RepID=A0A8D8URU6_9HEMI
MEDFKFKLKGLIQKQPYQIPVVSPNSSYYLTDQSEDEQLDENIEPSDDKISQTQREGDVIKLIEPIFFSDDDNVNIFQYELEKLKNSIDDVDELQKNMKALTAQHQTVCKQVVDLINQKQEQFNAQFEGFQEIQSQLSTSLLLCQSTRSKLSYANSLYTTSSLNILSTFRRRNVTLDLLKSFNSIKALLQTEQKLNQLLLEENYPSAISLILECTQVTHTQGLKHFSCIAALSSKLQDNLVMTEEYLDEVLSKCIEESKVLPCLTILCKSMWIILHNYYKVVKWHEKNTNISASDPEDFEVNLNKQYVHQKLQGGFTRLWNDVQGRVSVLILSSTLSSFKLDDFLQVLAIVHKLTLIGEEFCSSDSMELHNSIKTQSSNYFTKYHTKCLDELRIFLENEAWTPCPVKNDFSILHLQEFRSLRHSIRNASRTLSSGASNDDSSVSGGTFYFSADSDTSCPFDQPLHAPPLVEPEDILQDIPDDPSGYYSDDSEDGHSKNTGYDSHIKQTSCLTNTSLSILRLCGKYLQMSKYLKLIASTVIYSLFQLFEYYLYIVYQFFSRDQTSGKIVSVTSLKLQSVLKRIKENLIHSHDSAAPINISDRVALAEISVEVDLRNPDTEFGLTERVVAVESLVFLSSQFQLLHNYLKCLLSDQTNNTLHQFYTQTMSVVTDLRKPVYACVAWKSVDTQQILLMMSRVDWEVSDIIEKHSPYVDYIVQSLQVFIKKVETVRDQSEVQFPSAVITVLWENLITLVVRVLIEGFSCARKCSSGGRALMQLDWVQLSTKLSEMSQLKLPLPLQPLIDSYLKAYYMQESALEEYLRSQFTEYSHRQLESLVLCSLVCQNDKKTRQRLLTQLEEQKSHDR